MGPPWNPPESVRVCVCPAQLCSPDAEVCACARARACAGMYMGTPSRVPWPCRGSYSPPPIEPMPTAPAWVGARLNSATHAQRSQRGAHGRTANATRAILRDGTQWRRPTRRLIGAAYLRSRHANVPCCLAAVAARARTDASRALSSASAAADGSGAASSGCGAPACSGEGGCAAAEADSHSARRLESGWRGRGCGHGGSSLSEAQPAGLLSPTAASPATERAAVQGQTERGERGGACAAMPSLRRDA